MKQQKLKKHTFLVALLIFADIFTLTGFILSYGPWNKLRDLLITTAMTTKDHKYIAHILYDDETIKKVMSQNYVKESNDNTDTDAITIGVSEDSKKTYANKYEQEILKKDNGNDLYKIVKINGNGWVGYMGVVYDPTRVSLKLAPKLGVTGIFPSYLAKQSGAKLAMNASGFVDLNERGNGGTPTGTVIKNGKVVYSGGSTGYGGGIAGFTKKGVLVLTHQTPAQAIKAGVMDAVEFGPFLIVNGKNATIRGNGGWGNAPRSVLAQRKDGIVLFIVIDGRQPGYSMGISMPNMVKLLNNYGAYNAVNLDGGASSSLVEHGRIVNKPCAISATGERQVPNIWMLK